MAILIGHASISERGTVNGAKGDSTGKEVCVRTWYDKSWDYIAVHPDANVRERHARAIEQACANNNIGYGQSNRNTLNALAKNVGYDLSKVGKCNCDCSSLQNVAAMASGAEGVTYGSNGWTTSSMRGALKKAGYEIITDKKILKNASYCVRGAIYVKEGSHTVCGLSSGSKMLDTLSKVKHSTNNASTSKPQPRPTSKCKSNVKEWQRSAIADGYKFPKYGADGKWGSECEDVASKAICKRCFDSKGNFIWRNKRLTKIVQKTIGVAEDGCFGNDTYNGVINYQIKKGLVADGVVGKKTWKSILGV